jgi:cell division protein YceG involved in septum cleavage
MESDLTKKLNTNSYISISVVVLLIGALVWLNTKFGELHDGQKDTRFDVQALTTRLETIEKAKVTDRWSGTDMFKWAVKLQRDNPTIKVPEPKHED